MRNPHKFFPLLIAFLITAIYWNSLSNSYVWDDRLNFSENHAIRDLPAAARACFTKDYHRVAVERYYRPVVTLSYALEYRAWKLNPAASHAVNVTLHILASIALFFFLSLLFGSRAVPAAATLLFAAHPIATSAVAQVNGRMEIFCALFALLSAICFLMARRVPEKSFPYTTGSLFFLLLALLSKEMALTVPVLFLLIHFTSPSPRRRAASLPPPFLLAAAYLIFRLCFIGGSAVSIERALSPQTTLLTMVKVTAIYMRLLIFPSKLCADYFSLPIPASFLSADVLLSLLAITFTAAIAAVSFKRNRFVFFSILWFFITLAPVMNILPLLSFVSEKFLYLPSIGFCVFAAISLDSLVKFLKLPKVAFWLAILAFAAVYSAGTVNRNPVWKDELTLFSDTVECSPNSASAHVKLGNTLCNLDRCSEAIDEYKKAVSLQHDPVIFKNIGEAYAREGDYENAASSFGQYLKYHPSDLNACLRLGLAYELSDNLKEAASTYRGCERLAQSDGRIGGKIRSLESRLGKENGNLSNK